MSEKIFQYLNVIKKAVELIEAELTSVAPDPKSILNHQIQTMQSVTTEVSPVPEAGDNPDYLKARNKHVMDLMAIDCWPKAVVDYVDKTPTEIEQKKRAKIIIDSSIQKPIEGASVLDIGCADGWTTSDIMQRGAASVYGFDVIKHDRWNYLTGPQYTTDYSVIPNDFFDIVLMYDVLDHCEDAERTMQLALSSLKKSGTVYVRCHPWTSRHATHLYKQGINKAYLHLFLSWSEIRSLTEATPIFTRQEQNAVEAYRWWFRDFNIVAERFTRETVSDFFKNPAFKELIANEQHIQDIDAYLQLMEIQFVDYVITPK